MKWGESAGTGGRCWLWTGRQYMDRETLEEVDRVADYLAMLLVRDGYSESYARRTVAWIADGVIPGEGRT